jgi:hypothetical protein
MDATEITIYVVLVGAGMAATVQVLAARRARSLVARARDEDEAQAAIARDRLAEAERHWSELVRELLGGLERGGRFPQVEADRAARFRSFAILREAARIAAADGRPATFGTRDAEEATARCDERAAAARALVAPLRRAHELWSADIVAVGIPAGPAGDQVQLLSDRLESLALEGGDLNLFLWAAAARINKARVIARAPALRAGSPEGMPRARA